MGMYTGYQTASYKYNGCAMRFQNVTIPADAVIDSAYITLRAMANRSGMVVNSRIRGQNSSNPAAFSTQADFDARTWLGTTVNWDNIEAWTAGNDYNSPDISTIIQTIIGLSGWVSGNSLVLCWDDFDGRSTAVTNTARQGTSYDGNSAYAPKLVITYTAEEPKTSSDNGSGVESLAFRELGINEIGTGIEQSQTTAVVFSDDAGSGLEIGGLLKSLFGQDEGSGIDSIKILTGKAGHDLRLHSQRGQVGIPHKEVRL